MHDPARHLTIALPRRRLLLSLFAATASSCTKFRAIEDEQSNVTRFPQHLDKACRYGRSRIYDECGSQVAIYQAALAEADGTNKTLLVSYGAEWCIWCHVFDAYLAGNAGQFDYRYDTHRAAINENGNGQVAADAATLNNFAEKNFVLAHIEANYTRDGEEVLRRANAVQHFTGTLLFIFTTNRRGIWAATFDYEKAETRRNGPDWFRGYDRRKLLAELHGMRAAANMA